MRHKYELLFLLARAPSQTRDDRRRHQRKLAAAAPLLPPRRGKSIPYLIPVPPHAITTLSTLVVLAAALRPHRS
jgi:hypothetical protein